MHTYIGCDKPAVELIVASGPFTTEDSLAFDPLTALLETVKKDTPSAIILMGPFVDIKHPLIKNDKVDRTYGEIFDDFIMKKIAQTLKENVNVKIYMVPSLRDVNHRFSILPQPPFNADRVPKKSNLNINSNNDTNNNNNNDNNNNTTNNNTNPNVSIGRKKKRIFEHERLTYLSNPCTISLNEIQIGITNTDILFHMSKEEVAQAPKGKVCMYVCMHVCICK